MNIMILRNFSLSNIIFYKIAFCEFYFAKIHSRPMAAINYASCSMPQLIQTLSGLSMAD